MATVRVASAKCQNKDCAILLEGREGDERKKNQQSQQSQRTQRLQRLKRKQEYNIQRFKHSMDSCVMTHLFRDPTESNRNQQAAAKKEPKTSRKRNKSIKKELAQRKMQQEALNGCLLSCFSWCHTMRIYWLMLL